jgi:hypothetical protein
VEWGKEGRKGEEGKWREIIKLTVRYLLKYLDEEFEGKIILKSILIFKGLRKSIKNKL